MRTTFTRRFSAAHRLQNDNSPCERIHGHNYVAVIVVDCAETRNGMVLPADDVKAVVDEQYDHRLILEHDDADLGVKFPINWIVWMRHRPTTENLAKQIAEQVRDQAKVYLMGGKGYVQVTLYETPTISAEACAAWG